MSTISNLLVKSLTKAFLLGMKVMKSASKLSCLDHKHFGSLVSAWSIKNPPSLDFPLPFPNWSGRPLSSLSKWERTSWRWRDPATSRWSWSTVDNVGKAFQNGLSNFGTRIDLWIICDVNLVVDTYDLGFSKEMVGKTSMAWWPAVGESSQPWSYHYLSCMQLGL